MENKLPKDWQIKKLNEVSKIIMGQSPPSDTYNENAKGMPFFQGKAEFTDLYPVVKKYCSKPTKIAEPLDILLSVRAPVGTTNIANQQCCIGRGLAAIRFENYKYGFYFLRSIQHELDSKGTGTTFRAISGETIRETLIPFPNPKTQQAIVSKIEELFSELDKGIEDLKSAQQQLKTYRQSVLKWAFEGKLTNENVKEGELPKGWEIKTLGEVCFTTSGGTPSRRNLNYYNGVIPWVKSGELNKGIIYNTEEKITEEAIKNSSAKKFPKGTLLIALYGATIGKLAFLGVDAATNQAICGIYENKNISSYYLYYFLAFNKSKLVEQGIGGAQPNISQTILKNLLIPIAQLEEQHRIVQEIESRLSVADKMEESIAQSLQQAEALRQSILKKAFSGELV
ncbi:restriction endonuclease subunit S [Flavobacterium macrobrachii]|uniref:Restriction endonuclease subunit S n=1 Tax=Flavobacterium macrobrachii TaxID=591204 RepID=A0ABS2CVF4_9FLAO|nr:restriction endonuclease subunit S [Flavobacterium macrobrachii]MBM6498933.1 restriction endonuclease subunit S [Flavobacterium macrobrachii]